MKMVRQFGGSESNGWSSTVLVLSLSLPLPSSMSTIPSSLKEDGGEATAVPVDQDELQLVICVVGMTGS